MMSEKEFQFLNAMLYRQGELFMRDLNWQRGDS
jgi:hypothetical protein